MKKSDLLILLLIPLCLLVLAFINFNNAKEFGSFSEEVKERSNGISELKTSFDNIKNKNNVTSSEILVLNNKILTSTEGVLKHYSDFSGSMSKWLKELSYTILIMSLINIYLIIIMYRKYKNVNKNL